MTKLTVMFTVPESSC